MISGGEEVALGGVDIYQSVFHPKFFKADLYYFFCIVGVAHLFERESENCTAVEIHAFIIFRYRHAVVG